MKRRTIRTAAIGTGLAAMSAAAALFAERRLIESWRHNPDPLNGEPVRFDGDETLVPTDDGARISTRAAGDGPPVVLVHGVTGNHDDWGPIAAHLLASGRRVITVDQRGHGDSTVGTQGYGAPRLGRDLAAVFERLEIGGATLVGHSMGGMAALSMAVDRPDLLSERVDHLVPVATAATMAGVRYQVALWAGGLEVLDSVRISDTRYVLGAGLATFGDAPSLFMVQETVRQFQRCPDDVRHKATVALRTYDVADRLSAIDVPTTVVSGTDDHLTPLAGNELIAERIPGASLVVLAGAGHMVIWERARRLAELLGAGA